MAISPYLRGLREKVGSTLIQMPSATVIAFDDQGRVMLVHSGDTEQWVAPGGGIDPLEKPADAAVREMWEETGLFVELTGILGVYSGPEFAMTYPNGDRTSYVTTVFAARVVRGSAHPDGEETLAVRPVSEADLDHLENVAPWTRIVLADAFARRGQASFQPPTWQPE